MASPFRFVQKENINITATYKTVLKNLYVIKLVSFRNM